MTTIKTTFNIDITLDERIGEVDMESFTGVESYYITDNFIKVVDNDNKMYIFPMRIITSIVVEQVDVAVE